MTNDHPHHEYISLLLELSLEVGKGKKPEKSWWIFLEKLKQLSACSEVSLWRRNEHEKKLYRYISDECSDREIPDHLVGIDELTNPPSNHIFTSKSLPVGWRNTFPELAGRLLLVGLGGYGALALWDPNDQFLRLVQDDVFLKICQRQVHFSGILEEQIRIEERNKKKLQIIQKLRDWRGAFADLFENIIDPILVVDSDGIISNANKSARELLGINKSDYFGKKLRNYIPDDSKGVFDQILNSAKAFGAIVNYECDVCGSNGTILSCLVNCSIVEKNGNLVSYRISIHDISRRKKAEAQLEQLRQTQDKILNNLPVGLCLTDLNGNIIPLNPHIIKLFQNERGKLPDFQNFSYEEYFLYAEKERQRVEEILKNLELVSNDLVMLKNGSVLSRDFVPITYNDECVSKLWAFKDITDAYKAHTEVRSSEDRYRGVIENMSLGILEWDANQNVVTVYPSFLRIAGVDPVKLLGKKESELFESAESIFDKYQGVNALVVRFKIANSKSQWMLISTVPVFEHGNKLKGYLSVIYDMTERKAMEQELREAKERALEDRDYERCFLANMSHEIRTPLNAIAGMTHLLRNTNLSAAQKQYVDSLDSSTNNLLHLLNDVLDISKTDA